MIQPKPPNPSTATHSSKITHSYMHRESRSQIPAYKMTDLDSLMTHRKSAVVMVVNVLKKTNNSFDPTLSPIVKV